MSYSIGKDREGREYRRLDNMFWRDLRNDLSKHNRNVGLAPEIGTLLLPEQQRHLSAWWRAYQLENNGTEPMEARRRAFSEFYPQDRS